MQGMHIENKCKEKLNNRYESKMRCRMIVYKRFEDIP